MTINEALAWADKSDPFYGNRSTVVQVLATEVRRLGENSKLRIDELDRLLMENEGLKARLEESIEANANCALLANSLEEKYAELAAAREEIARLQNKLNTDSQNFEIECLKARAEAAKAENSALRKVVEAVKVLYEPFPVTCKEYTADGLRVLEALREYEGRKA